MVCKTGVDRELNIVLKRHVPCFISVYRGIIMIIVLAAGLILTKSTIIALENSLRTAYSIHRFQTIHTYKNRRLIRLIKAPDVSSVILLYPNFLNKKQKIKKTEDMYS